MTAAFRFRGTLNDEDGRLDALWQRGCLGIQQDGEEVVAYFEEQVDLPIGGRWVAVPDVDYLEDYRTSLRPLRLDRLVVAPTHRRAVLNAGQKVLWLDPGQAFGSGHHETTKLALQALEGLSLAGRNVLDVGSGSGILAIAADLLGAVHAHGIDTDPVAVRVAEENADLNSSRATFALGSLPLSHAAPSYDVVVANLYAELHRDLMEEYSAVVASGASLFLTGILADRCRLVTDAIPPGLSVETTRTEREWVLIEIGVQRR